MPHLPCSIEQRKATCCLQQKADDLNFFSKCAWYFLHNYQATENGQPTTRWILYKDVTSDLQITEGFLTKELYKAKQEKK